MYHFLPFILVQELGATTEQVAVMVSLRPVVSLLSIYFSSAIANRTDRIKKNIIYLTLLAHLPILFFPFATNTWYFIAASAFFISCEKGAKPAWMELLKINLKSDERQKLFSWVATCSYSFGMLAPWIFGIPMDQVPGLWRWLFVGTSLLSMSALLAQIKIKVDISEVPKIEKISRVQAFLKPWIEAKRLLATDPLFRLFQWGFFFGGAGLMLMKSAIPHFIMRELGFSYTELSFAVALYTALGYATTSPFWAKWMRKENLFQVVGLVTLIMAIFPLCILGGKIHIYMIYLAYALYGIMQAGSEISWHLSGPLFARQGDSSTYTSVNVLLVGVRGLIFPSIGTLLLSSFMPITPLLVGSLLCLIGTYLMLSQRQFQKISLGNAE